jgi:hypothetical protein
VTSRQGSSSVFVEALQHPTARFLPVTVERSFITPLQPASAT